MLSLFLVYVVLQLDDRWRVSLYILWTRLSFVFQIAQALMPERVSCENTSKTGVVVLRLI